MTATSAEQMRPWTGPAILSFGFRPFFLLGALWAVFAMIVWVLMLSGTSVVSSRFDPVSWHAHEFLFGYLGSIIAGFLLTAVPNWTGRLPMVGWRLGGLVALWLAARLAIAISELMPEVLVAIFDLAFPVTLGALILCEIVAGKNWRNLIVIGMLAIFTLANFLFHFEAAQGTYAAQGYGLRLGLASALMMVSVIGGRIVPSFTRNWFVKMGSEIRPAPPMQRFDKVVLMTTIFVLAVWVVWSDQLTTGILLLVLAALHVSRLLRWKSQYTSTEPLVWVLHAGYAFVPFGALAAGLSILFPESVGLTASQHVWMVGAIGLMTLAVMTRATLGHTGRDLHAGPATLGIYLALIAAVAARIAAGALPHIAMNLYGLSAFLWISAFGGFVVIYGPMLLTSKPSTP